jgi:hypothetical protein
LGDEVRIISKFYDYYDGAGWFSDTPVYIRKTKEVNLTQPINEVKKTLVEVFKILNTMPRAHWSGDVQGVIAFCGKAYPFWWCIDQFFYDTQYMENHCKKRLQRFLGAKGILNDLRRRGYFTNSLTHNVWARFIRETNFDISPESFRFVNAPIFLITKSEKIYVNPMLRSYNFASQIDPYTAYQNIERYLSNELTIQMDPDVERSDELVRDSKGFNDWSFRRHKEESKKNKKGKK